MPTNIASRVTLIAVILLAALWAIFPGAPKALLAPFTGASVDLTPDLKPGIDISGGTSLIYEIKDPSGRYDPELGEQIATVLKRRVDPDGVRNLIWRPSGSRLEIQMPLSRAAREGEPIRKALADAQATLERTNIRVGEVENAIEKLSGDHRRDALNRLAGGSRTRGEIFGALASLHDRLLEARRAGNLELEAKLLEEYEPLRDRILDTNIDVQQLQDILQLKPELRQARLQQLRERFPDFPERQQAIDQFVAAYDAYLKVRDAIDSAAQLKRDLRGSGVLSFNILATDLSPAEYDQWVQRLQNEGPRPRPGDVARWFEVADQRDFGARTVTYNDKNYILAYITPERSLMKREGQPPWALQRAGRTNENGEWKVTFAFDPQGAKYFGELTGRHIPQGGQEYYLAIILDEKVVSAPRINSRIDGFGVIEGGRGGFDPEEINYLVNTLNAGSLPAQLTSEPIRERTVGPQLGDDNLRAGFIACLLGLAAVGLFMIVYYYWLGLVATIAVMLNLLLILGGMAMIDATFTLPGIAGIVLTIGMAVDANVLIFERLREEKARGLSLRMAMRNAYDRAWSAIIDGNLTTAITSVFLYWFGSEEVRGFGITLLIGLLSSMFTALYVTKTIYAILIDKLGVEHLGSLPETFPRWNAILTPDVDWVGKTKYFASFSAVFIGIGLAMFFVRWNQGQVLDIEFTGGTAVQFSMKEPLPINEVRRLVTEASNKDPRTLPVPTVQSVGADNLSYEIATPNTDAVAVKEALIKHLGDKLDVAQASKFVGSDLPLAEAMASGVVLPIADRQTRVPGIDIEDVRSHVGGAAILLRDISPPLTEEAIRQRLEQQAIAAGGPRPWTNIDVVVEPGGRDAVVLFHNVSLDYDVGSAEKLQAWMDGVAGPTWNLLRDSISRPAELQSITKFDGQVANEAKTDTIVALLFSIAGIMAYIWFRFGDLQHGTATVVALVHDTAFTLAAVGFAHYLSYVPFFNDVLMIEPFRVNLVLVAAVLTVIGYSMNDTVVVFDRVRENRGRYGHLNRKLINDSINQTLSRTLLTSVTTLVVILIMYFLGGPGIHGFTYALLVGILIGTYSSIAIASPILLFSKFAEKDATVPATPAKLQGVGS